jgi:hypothetical protein
LAFTGCGGPAASAGDGGAEDPSAQLEECGVPEPCSEQGVFWDRCNPAYEYRESDRCFFEQLEGEDAFMLWASSVALCGDISDGVSYQVFRWQDGTMTCVFDTGDEVTVHECNIDPEADFEACMAQLDADLEPSEWCLNPDLWLVLGDEIEPACG